VGKRLLFLLAIFITGLFSTVFAQEEQPSLKIINFDQDDSYLADPLRITLSPGDSLMFRSLNGEFSIFIEEAIMFLEIEEIDLTVEVSDTDPESPIYVVREVDQSIDKTYSIFCVSKKVWPEAPPRIILVR
jgi:hypothetical protein